MKFELITPAAQVAASEASFVELPGDAGDFGVLPGHMPLISTLRDGEVVQVTDAAGKKSRFSVQGAFADIQSDGVTVLAERAAVV